MKEISTRERPPMATLIAQSVDRLKARSAKLIEENRAAQARGDKVKACQTASQLRILGIRGQLCNEIVERRSK